MDSSLGWAGSGKALQGCEFGRLGLDFHVLFSFKSNSSRIDCNQRGTFRLHHIILALWKTLCKMMRLQGKLKYKTLGLEEPAAELFEELW